MSIFSFKSFFKIIICLTLTLFLAPLAGASGDADVYDTVELQNGEKITGTVLTGTFTFSTPYSLVMLEKDKITEIVFDNERENHDIVLLNAAGNLEGSIEEPDFLFKTVNGENMTLKKKECKKITFKK